MSFWWGVPVFFLGVVCVFVVLGLFFAFSKVFDFFLGLVGLFLGVYTIWS